MTYTSHRTNVALKLIEHRAIEPISPCTPSSSSSAEETSSHLVLALVVDECEQTRIREAARGYYRIVCARTVGEFRNYLGRNPAAVWGALVEPVDAEGTSTVPLLTQLREMLPRAPLVGYCRLEAGSSRDLVALARAGVHDVVFRGFSNCRAALRAALVASEHAVVVSRVLAHLPTNINRNVRSLIEYGVLHGRALVGPAQVAAALGLHRRSLVNRCQRAGFPPPAQVLTWCRLFAVAGMLEQPACTIDYVAATFGFSSGTGLRNLIRRHLGVTGTELRSQGGLDFVLGRFLSLCELRNSEYGGGERQE
jgi:AraC-like DNA-binding protein